MKTGGDIGQGAKFPTRTCEGYDANDGTAWGGERRRAAGAAHYKRRCLADLRDRSAAALERASATCGGEEGKSRRETWMAAAARAARGAIGDHSPALRIIRQSRSRSTQLQRVQDRSAAALELRRGRVRWKKEEGYDFFLLVQR
jgi:hypothetical protein